MQRFVSALATLALVGALFSGAPAAVRASGATYYVSSAAHVSGGSCADPDYTVDGTADNVQIQAAIDAAGADDTVYLCAGTYHLANTLLGGDPMTLQGAGQGVTILDGGATFANVVKTTIFLTDMADFAAVNRVYELALGTSRPARSTVQVAALPKGARVEIECIASLG